METANYKISHFVVFRIANNSLCGFFSTSICCVVAYFHNNLIMEWMEGAC